MKNMVGVLAFVCVMMTSIVFGEEAPAFQTSPQETITFRIEKMKVKAGEATLALYEGEKLDGQDVAVIVFRADGFNFLDEETIYANPKTFHPMRIDRNLNIFGRKEKITEEYLAEGTVKITKHVGGKTKVETLKPGGKPDNIYGFLIRYRREGAFTIGDTVKLHLPTKDVVIKLENKKPLKIFGKEYEAYYLVSQPGKYKIWLDNSPEKIPLKISGAIGAANTTMVMRNYSGKQ